MNLQIIGIYAVDVGEKKKKKILITFAKEGDWKELV